MKKKLALLFITTSFITLGSAKAEYLYGDTSDYTGDAFFAPPVIQKNNILPTNNYDYSGADYEGENESSHTTPPVKQLRLMLKNKSRQQELRNSELAPTAKDVYSARTETSEYASKEVKEEFDEEMSPDGFEADEESIEEDNKKKKSWFGKKEKNQNEEDTENIVLDCENIDYDTPNALIYAKGNVSVEFVKQKTTVKADVITFDRMNNTIKAEGNVRILKGEQVITGDYIFVDLNEESALIENPVSRTATMEIKSKKGFVYGDRVVQEDGSMTIDQAFPINFRSGRKGPRLERMIFPKNETITEDMEKGIIKLQVNDIKITQKGDLETILLTNARLFRGDKKLLRIKRAKFYTNKNHDYAETDHWEVGSIRGLGVYAGTGVVFELPKGSVLKAMPILNYKSGFGIGGMGRFQSGTNITTLAYGTAKSKIIGLGKQKLDDDLYLQYGMNAYMDDWFFGRRRPKYGVDLVYKKSYSTRNFLVRNQSAAYTHRLEAGYYQDLDFDNGFEKLRGNNIGTTRFRYMAEGRQNIFEYKDIEKLKALSFGVTTQLSAAAYGTGDTQVVGRLGPRLHTQYKRWMQDIGYFFSAYDDNTPMPVYDAYRYGKQNIYLRESFRVNRNLVLSWFTSANVTNDSVNDRTFQENSIYVSVGPDDFKVNLGYDFIRQNLYFTFLVMADAKGTKLEYDTFEIKQDKKAEKKEVKKSETPKSAYEAPVKPKVLKKAVVEDIKVMEDVL